MKEKTEFYCHECNGYITVELDMELNGNHVVNCPKCNHEHCRVIKNGVVTEERWASRNGGTFNYTPTMASYSVTSIYFTTSSSDAVFLNQGWMDSTSYTTG